MEDLGDEWSVDLPISVTLSVGAALGNVVKAAIVWTINNVIDVSLC